MPRFALLCLLALAVAGCDSGVDPAGPPVSARIVGVSVGDFPVFDNVNGTNAAWDGGNDDADVYFRLYDDEYDYRTDADVDLDRLNAVDDGNVDAINSDRDVYRDPTTLDLPLIWEIDPGYVVRDLDDALYIALFDQDGSNSDDPMAATETFVLADVAPSLVTGRSQTISLRGATTDLNDREVRVILTVVFDD